jgi:hypothetical protein
MLFRIIVDSDRSRIDDSLVMKCRALDLDTTQSSIYPLSIACLNLHIQFSINIWRFIAAVQQKGHGETYVVRAYAQDLLDNDDSWTGNTTLGTQDFHGDTDTASAFENRPFTSHSREAALLRAGGVTSPLTQPWN